MSTRAGAVAILGFYGALLAIFLRKHVHLVHDALARQFHTHTRSPSARLHDLGKVLLKRVAGGAKVQHGVFKIVARRPGGSWRSSSCKMRSCNCCVDVPGRINLGMLARRSVATVGFTRTRQRLGQLFLVKLSNVPSDFRISIPHKYSRLVISLWGISRASFFDDRQYHYLKKSPTALVCGSWWTTADSNR